MSEIIILGMGTSRSDCPYDMEVWSCNTGYRQIGEIICPRCRDRMETLGVEERKKLGSKWGDSTLPKLYMNDSGLECEACDYKRFHGRVDKIFLAHAQAWDADGTPIFNWDEMNYLAGKGVEIWNTRRVEGLKARRLDWKRLAKKFGCAYFSDAITYMIAHAIDRHSVCKNGVVRLSSPLKLYIYGCDMLTRDEYNTEKGGLEYWIAYLRGLGGEVWVHPLSALMKTPTGKPYGEKYFKWKDIDPKGIFRKNRKPTPTGIKQNALDRIICPNDRK